MLYVSFFFVYAASRKLTDGVPLKNVNQQQSASETTVSNSTVFIVEAETGAMFYNGMEISDEELIKRVDSTQMTLQQYQH